MKDLSVDFCGLRIENPFMLSSAPPTATGDMIRRAFKWGWGGAVTKTVGLEATPNVRPRFAAMMSEERRVYGFENIELITDRPLEYWIPQIKKIKKEFPNKVLFVSIMGNNLSDWQKIAQIVQSAGADGLELNVSCPMMIGASKKGWGAAVGQNPEATAEVIKCVKDVTAIPVMVKMTPNVTNLPDIVKAAEKAGTDAISGINTVSGFMGVDIDNLEPMPSVNGRGAFGGLCGKAIKPIALRCIIQIAKSTNLPISGIGGISIWKDAVEFLLLGSTTLQICTSVMFDGYRIIEDLKSGLSNYMEDKRFDSLKEIIGLILPKIGVHEELDFTYNVIPEISKEKCIKCDLCYLVCRDGGYQAIELNEERFPIVNAEKCDGCSLCYYRCPVPCCITMKKIEKLPAPRIINEKQ